MTQPRILLVDDEADILELSASILEEVGCRVSRAANADIALLLIEEGVPFDLMITDVVLPGFLDGFGLAHRARALLPNLAIIYATGFSDVARVRARGSVFGEVLTKPFRADDLIKAAHAALRAHPAT
jgi:CheY-like chemotaxis protein